MHLGKRSQVGLDSTSNGYGNRWSSVHGKPNSPSFGTDACFGPVVVQTGPKETRLVYEFPLLHYFNTRSSTHSHLFQVSLPNPRTLPHKSFISRTCNSWNTLLSSSVPESYNLLASKSKINKLDLISLYSWPFTVFYLLFGGSV